MTPRIRFFCLVIPVQGPQLGFDYLDAFDQTGYGVQAAPIGPAYLMSGPWPKLNHLFLGAAQAVKPYVNVVCAPPNLLLGHVLRTSDVKPPNDGGDKDEVVYEPQTALGGLYTLGVANIAITMPRPKSPEMNEIKALRQYDAVLCPTHEDAVALRDLGIVSLHVPPDREQLAKVVSWVLPAVVPPG